MTRKFTRRQAVLGVSSTLLLPTACTHTQFGEARYSGPTFAHGVASGDPDTTSVVIWTRVSGIDDPVLVDWYVAKDPEMLEVVSHGQFATDASRDHTVKPVADGLEPGHTYYYQFVLDNTPSPLGRTKTLPTGHLERLVLAVASCSNYAFGFFNAYEVIAEDNAIDLVVHLGDYIYEHRALGGYGGATGRRIGRNHEPGHEITSLSDYRTRHAQYKSDPQSIAMHARHPLVVTWDDHESANNPWMYGAENHQLIDGDWFERRAASMQAFYEWLPVRDPGPGGSWERYWRHYRFADLVSLITLESRHTGRSKQITWDRRILGSATPGSAQAYYHDVVGAPDRNMLSAEMEGFLITELAETARSGRRWRIIGNQSIMAKRRPPDLDVPFFRNLRKQLTGSARDLLDDVATLGALGVTWNLDAWDGYPAARERFYKIAKNAGVTDLLVVSGDSHSYWANVLYDEGGASMGVELGTTGITSPPSFLSFGVDGLARWDEMVAAENEEIVWADGRYRGFIRLDITHDDVHADFVTVTDVESRDYEKRIVNSVDIEHIDGRLRYA